MLEKIHISFISGSRGDFLSALVYAGINNIVPSDCKIYDTGAFKHNSRDYVNTSHKALYKVISNPTQLISLDYTSWQKSLKECHTKEFKSDYQIGISHYINFMYIHSWFREMFVKSRPIIIQPKSCDAVAIATQALEKNPIEHKMPFDKKLKETERNISRLLDFKDDCPDLLYLDYQSMLYNVKDTLGLISEYKKVKIIENASTKKLLDEYLTNNLKYDHYLR